MSRNRYNNVHMRNDGDSGNVSMINNNNGLLYSRPIRGNDLGASENIESSQNELSQWLEEFSSGPSSGPSSGESWMSEKKF